MTGETPGAAGGAKDQARAYHALFDETVALFHRLRWAAELLHDPAASGGGRPGHRGGRHGGRGRGFGRRHGRGRAHALTAARRGILRSVREQGAQTVPDLARSRRVSRQHVQTIVNGLEEAGLVRLVDNPSHKRSRLVELTERGSEAVDVMLEREMEFFGALDGPVEIDSLRAAAETLRRVRQALQGSPAMSVADELGDEAER